MDRYLTEAETQPADLFTGGGEMGALVRAFDWASTPVGSIERWPHSLRVAVGILLRSEYPMFLWWGPDLIQFYNDRYRPCLGNDKHPQALGQTGRECWAEIWPIIGPLVESVMAGGPSTWSEDQFIPITRSGYLEEVYWTFSYSAVLEENGKVGGVLVVCSETTGRVRAERRLRTLAGITGNAIEAKTTEAVAAIAARQFAGNSADLPFALLYFLTSDNTQLRLAETVGLAAGTPASPLFFDRAKLPLHSTQDWGIGDVLETGTASFIDDIATRFDPLPGGPWEVPSTSALVLPISMPGETYPIGVLVAGISPGQVFDASYREFLQLVTAALAAALSNVRAYQAAQERARSLAELDRAKTTFFSNISHEFRTPLTLSLGPLETLLSNEQYPLVSEQRAHVQMVHRNALRQLKLVNMLLDFARIEAGRAEAVYVPTNLAQFTAELASTFQSAVERAGLQLIMECPPLPEPVYVDPDLWEKIILNLLSNAFKFTFDGYIRIALHPTEEGVELVVQDTGVGIPEADVPHLFKRFYQAHVAQARTREGSGIGLALVQELVHLHGGNISVQSTEGVGTTFTIHLPSGYSHLPAEHLFQYPQTDRNNEDVSNRPAPTFGTSSFYQSKPKRSSDYTSGTEKALVSTASSTASYVEEALRWLPETPTSQEPFLESSTSDPSTALSQHSTAFSHENTATGKNSRVLVVDDNADMREYLKRLLAPSYQVQLAADGTIALALAKNTRPDLIISDVMMPGLDGFALLKALRTNHETTSIPVILLSARAGEEATLEGLQAGANDYLVKPFSAREVLARVQAQLEITRLRREAELAREHLHALLMQAPAIICVFRGPQHIYELANPLYYQLVGQRELLGKPVREALPELEGQGLYDVLDQVYTTGEPFLGTEIKIELRRGEESYFNFVYQPIRTIRGEVEGIMVHAVEVTEQVRSRQRMGTFLGIASHELKNPLTTIKGNVELAQRRVNKALQQKTQDENGQHLLEGISLLLKRANQQVDFQNRLVSDLVDTTRIQIGKLELRIAPADLNMIVRDAVEEQRQLAPTRVIHLDLPPDNILILNMDADRVGQVVTNYLSNALKYSEENQSVSVRVEIMETEARVSVQDAGPGLSMEEQERIWERFYRTPDVQVKSGTGIGLGLGLYICQTIIKEHGGQVGVESVKGTGSTFWFTLPLA